MKKKILIICLTVITGFLMILPLGSCKNLGIPDYKLTIVIENGVQGTPAPGTYTYKELETIDYKYTAINTTYLVEVLVNETRRLSEGQFIMYTDLNVVSRIFDIRDTWDFTLDKTTDSSVAKREFTVTFTGNDPLSGQFTDSNSHTGTWLIENSKLTMTYSNWFNYTLTSDSVLSMGGTWSGEGKTSTWSASRSE
ncbi:MAG: hypothetical protein MUF15_00460 [Acidobacteria bacterium]|jgi:hypothetical protein|nr:hypothetical protein [Acidobacteriota bacterium]